tara:strand:- start:3169 stop:3510 length:342 start_codon:yes stop_codon:yes gene_type:complete
MIAAGVIIVLACVPGVEIEKFQPLGFEFNTDSKLSAWGLLLAVLSYNAARFGADCWIDYNIWSRDHLTQNPSHSINRDIKMTQKYFWIWDFAPPLVMAIIGLFGAIKEIVKLI